MSRMSRNARIRRRLNRSQGTFVWLTGRADGQTWSLKPFTLVQAMNKLRRSAGATMMSRVKLLLGTTLLLDDQEGERLIGTVPAGWSDQPSMPSWEENHRAPKRSAISSTSAFEMR